MLILGIETATEQVGVAIGGHEGVIATFEVARGRRHAEILAPAIEFVCRQADIELCEFGCIAVDVGPGLFTGMRVGLAPGKALAQALRIPMIGISSLDLLAFPCRHTDRVVVPVIDARKSEVFWAMYRQVPGGVQQVRAPTVGPVDELVGRPAGAQPGRALRRRRRDPLPRRDPRGLPLRDLGSSAHPSAARSCSSPTPAPCARSGCALVRSSRSTCASPMPRSTGPRGGRGDERAPMSERSERIMVTCVGPRARSSARSGASTNECAGPVAAARRRRGTDRHRGDATKHLSHMLPIEQDAYPKPWSRAVFESELEQVRRGSRYYIVARRRRTVVGYAGLWFVTDPDGDQAHVTNIAVAADHRRGRRRRRGCSDRSPPRRSSGGCIAWTLEVRASNTGAQELYRLFGFAPAGVRKRYYENTEDAIVMWCHDIQSDDYARRLRELGGEL